MVEKQHDVDYADPEQADQNKVLSPTPLHPKPLSNPFAVYRLTCQRWRKWLERSSRSAFSRWDASSTVTEINNGRNVALAMPSSWEIRRPRRSDSSWDKRRLSSQLPTLSVSSENKRKAWYISAWLFNKRLINYTAIVETSSPRYDDHSIPHKDITLFKWRDCDLNNLIV